MSKPVIEIKELKLKINGIELFHDFTLELRKEERIGITGPSGCGKSTLLKSLIASLPNGSEYISFRRDKSFNYSYVPQTNGLLPWFSLQRNLNIFNKDTEHLLSVVRYFKLNNNLNSFPHQLSGGEYQRAILAAAIINSPDVFLADEPLTELDISGKWKLLSFWSEYIKKMGASLLLVSHDIETLIYLCDKVIVLSDKPSVIVKEFDIVEPHPRSLDFLTSEEFINAKKMLLETVAIRNSMRT